MKNYFKPVTLLYLSAFTFLLWTISANAQLDSVYCSCRWQADSLFGKKEYRGAAKWYTGSLQSGMAGRREYYKLAVCYANLGEEQNALAFMRKAVKNGFFYFSLDDMKADSNLVRLRKLPEWPELEQGIRQNIEQNVRGTDPALREELLAMRVTDQLHRSDFKLRDSLKLSGHKNAADSLWHIQMQADSVNQYRVKQILRTYGWPGFGLIGSDGDNALWVICQHADKDVAFQKRCLKYLEEALLLHNTNPANYAYLLDRVLVNTGQPQVFGTQFQEKRENGRLVDLIPRTIANEAEVDKRRNCVGLPRMAFYKKEALEHFSK